MIMNSVYITIEEWASENDIQLKENQIQDLVDAVGIAYEMSLPGGYGVGTSFEEDKEKRELREKIDLLERFIRSKGYDISVGEKEIEVTTMKPCGSSHYATHTDVFR